MWYARIGSTAPKHWRECLHMPLTWKGAPIFKPNLNHIDQYTLDRARLAFPTGTLVLLGVYYSTKGDD